MSERGQTVHDYMLGISIVLLTVAAVFAFFPNVFAPFEEPVDTENHHMATRLAEEIVAVNGTDGSERTVNVTALAATLADGSRLGDLRTRSGIPTWKQVNVTVQDAGGEVVLRGEVGTAGTRYRPGVSDPTATRVRTIQAHNESSRCADSCQLVVRVWTGG